MRTRVVANKSGSMEVKTIQKNGMNRKKTVFFLIGMCVSMNILAQRVLNLNEDTADVKLMQGIAATVNVPQAFLKEAKASRTFAINPALQNAKSVTVGDVVNLQLFEGKNYMATVSDTVTDVNGNFALTLKFPDYPMAFAIITTDTERKSLVTVSIPELSQRFGSRFDPDTRCYLIEIDDSKIERLRSENDVIPIPVPVEETEMMDDENQTALQLRAGCSGPAVHENPNTSATISLLVVYTPAAAASSYASSHGGISGVISSMIALGNTCFSNSQTGVTLQLAHSAQVSYTEPVPHNMDATIDRLQSPNDGIMDNVHALRKQYNADLVQLLTVESDMGGYAYLSSANGNYNYGFSVVNVTQVADDYPCSVHEIGHNLGLGHGAQQTSVTANGIFSYSQGWRWKENPGNNYYASVMSYAGNYYGDGIIPQYTPYFSNPNIDYMGAPTGDAAQADAARSIREIKHVIAYYSDRANSFPDAPTNIVVSNPTDYGATFSWSACNNASSYRVCYDIGGGSYAFWSTTNTSLTVSESDRFQPCNVYEIWVSAFNGCGDQVRSEIKTFSTACASATVVTQAATNITQTTATLNSSVSPGSETITSQGYQYRVLGATSWQTTTNGNLTGLTPSTTYEFHAYITTASNTYYGSKLTFTTQAAPALSVSPANYHFAANGGVSSAITVSSNQSWTVSDDASWLTTSRTSGSNNGTFTMTATANTATSPRSATVTVSGGGLTRTINVTQEGALPAPTLSVSPANYHFAANGGASSAITVSSNQSWTVSDDASWLTTSSTGGSNNGTFTMTATANTATSPRSATVTVSGGELTCTISVTQAGDSPALTLSVSPASYHFAASGGVSSAITVSSNQSWTVSSNASWLTTSSTDGNNNGTFTMTATANTATSSRSATVTVSGGELTCTISVTQAGDSPAPVLTVSPTSYHFAANGGASSAITVSSNQSWTVSDNASWLTTSSTNGNNNGTFTMTATANTATSPRSATVTVSGGGLTNTISVTQEGAYWEIGNSIVTDVTAALNNNMLTISGAGAMQDWAYNQSPPWYNMNITNVVIHEGVTTLGAWCFKDCNLVEIHSESPTPPNAGENCFYGVNKTTCTLYVPAGALDTYKSAYEWKDFFNILTGTAGIPASQPKIFPNPVRNDLFIQSDSRIEKVEIYAITGTLVISESNFTEKISVSALPRGIYLLRVKTDKGLTVSKIVKE